ncbi:MAG: DUF2490 domain-containing protein [Gemmatimonadota bacterium]
MRRILVVSAALVTVAWGPRPASAQTNIEIDRVRPQLWVDYNPTVPLTSKWSLIGDVGVRSELKADGWWRVVVRPGVEYKLSDVVRVGGGVGNFITGNDIAADRWEIRPWQGIAATWPNWKLPFHHFLRLEERFDLDTQTWRSATSLRIRYLIGTSYRWGSFFWGSEFWEVSASLEMFGTLAGEQGQSREQVRAALGIERSASRAVRVRFEAVWQKRGLLFVSDQTVDDLFLRVRVYHEFLP